MVELLQKADIFKGCKVNLLKQISAFTSVEAIVPGQILLKEDEENDYDLFIVVSGRVQIYVSSKFFADDKEENKTIYTINPGDNFGEMSCIIKRRRSASAKAITEGEILRIDGNKLTTLFENNNEAGYNILKKLYASLYERIQNSNFMLRNYLI
ncbi:MAG: cyclic nucleotide-binding domain-containing protein [Candidatus Delongbacteria bacterium]|jgi:CRP-like cAMP-binding protein|nr:cyclic nucleotide-binding domain-containing protein [Candidatus Delongbacteria bacterium]